MDDKRIKLFRDEKVSTAINQLSLPAIVGLLVMAVYGFVDTMFVAWLGTAATAATIVMVPIMMLMSSFGSALGVGSASYVSRLLGMNKPGEANKVATVIFATAAALGIGVTLLAFVFMTPVLGFFGAEGEVLTLAGDYGRYIFMAAFFAVTNQVLNNLLRAEGSARLSMVGMLVGALANIILDPLFIFTFGFGIAGAAMATALSQVISFVVLFSRYVNGHAVLSIRLKYLRPSLSIYTEVVRVGLPTLVRQVLSSVSIGILNTAAVSYGGKDLLAAVGLIFRIVVMPLYIIYGIGQGFQPVAGYNFGAGNRERVMEALRHTMTISFVIAASSGILMAVFNDELLTIFRAEPGVAVYGAVGILWYVPAIMMMAVSNTIATFYQALGKSRESMILSVTRQGVFFIPVILTAPSIFGVTGILATQLISDILTLILSLALFMPYVRSTGLDKDMKAQVVPA